MKYGQGVLTCSIFIQILQNLSAISPKNHALAHIQAMNSAGGYNRALTLRVMFMNQAHPYEQLTPDLVLDAIESTGLMTDARILALNSYDTLNVHM
ncbi:MAG: hypothetical protein B0W54_12670 [Cellvibrio sp. 79]|nr:MAG: hypothetical protein B0W54_12670 [Cellvibrio sp. 79]